MIRKLLRCGCAWAFAMCFAALVAVAMPLVFSGSIYTHARSIGNGWSYPPAKVLFIEDGWVTLTLRAKEEITEQESMDRAEAQWEQVLREMEGKPEPIPLLLGVRIQTFHTLYEGHGGVPTTGCVDRVLGIHWLPLAVTGLGVLAFIAWVTPRRDGEAAAPRPIGRILKPVFMLALGINLWLLAGLLTLMVTSTDFAYESGPAASEGSPSSFIEGFVGIPDREASIWLRCNAYSRTLWLRGNGIEQGASLGRTWLWAALLSILPLVSLRVHLRRIVKPGCCGACGYDLRGSPAGGTCPECGAGVLRGGGSPSG